VDQALALFGRPDTVTGFYRALRGIKSKEDDSFTLILQYSGEQENLTVTVKTSVINRMPQPLKYFIRGRKGTYVKYGEDQQETQTSNGVKPTDAGYGTEPSEIWGALTTEKQFNDGQSKVTGHSGNELYHGKFPSKDGSYIDYYEDVVKAIRKEGPVVIRPESARDGLRIVELGRQSADEGRTVKMD
jgi:predicted dehydrogenase